VDRLNLSLNSDLKSFVHWIEDLNVKIKLESFNLCQSHISQEEQKIYEVIDQMDKETKNDEIR
jgi:hypothetical protein